MNTATRLAKEKSVDFLHVVLKQDQKKYLCFTSCDKEDWIIHVSDGIDVWRLPHDVTKLESHKDLAGVSSYDAYFSKFRQAFTSGDVTVDSYGHKVTLTVGSGSSALAYDLYEGTVNQRKTDLQRALFVFAETCTDLQRKLRTNEEELATVKKQRQSIPDQASIPGFELKMSTGNQVKVVKQQGLSIIHPASRKRKAAKGVEFD